MYRGFKQNKKHSLTAERFYAKPRLVAGIGFPLLSTEIICQGGFCPGFSVTSRLNPYNTYLHSLIIIPNRLGQSQAFEHAFLSFFRFFRKKRHIFFVRSIETGSFLMVIARFWRKYTAPYFPFPFSRLSARVFFLSCGQKYFFPLSPPKNGIQKDPRKIFISVSRLPMLLKRNSALRSDGVPPRTGLISLFSEIFSPFPFIVFVPNPARRHRSRSSLLPCASF